MTLIFYYSTRHPQSASAFFFSIMTSATNYFTNFATDTYLTPFILQTYLEGQFVLIITYFNRGLQPLIQVFTPCCSFRHSVRVYHKRNIHAKFHFTCTHNLTNYCVGKLCKKGSNKFYILALTSLWMVLMVNWALNFAVIRNAFVKNNGSATTITLALNANAQSFILSLVASLIADAILVCHFLLNDNVFISLTINVAGLAVFNSLESQQLDHDTPCLFTYCICW